MSAMNSAPQTSTDALPTLLARHAQQRGSAVAVQYKVRGLVQTCTWHSLLRALEDARARSAADEHAPHALGLTWLLHALLLHAPSELTASHSAAHAGGSPPSLRTDDVLWLDPQLDRASALSLWLHSGAVLAIGEAVDTAEVDRRELAPTVLLAEARWYDELADDVRTRAARARGPRKALLRWAFATAADSPRARAPSHWLARGIVLRPLADQLGLARTHLALSAGQPSELAQSLLAALGVPLRVHGHDATLRTGHAARTLAADPPARFATDSSEVPG